MSIDSLAPPWCRICRLTFKFPGGEEKQGSGWIGGEDWVVGAAHCAYDDAGNRATQVRVQAGLGGTVYAAERHSDKIIIPREYAQSRDSSWDIVVIVTGPFSRSTIGWLPYGSLADEAIVVDGCEATIGGYDPCVDRYRITAHSHLAVQARAHRLRYRVRTHEGMSGSPVWIDHRGYFWVVGIHTHNESESTQAVYVDDERADWIFRHT